MRRGVRAGFTLVELIVALAVAGLVAAAAYGAVAMVGDAWERTRAERGARLGAVTARRAVAAWFRAADADAGPFRGTRRSHGARASDEVRFGVSDGGPLHAGPHRIRLWIDRDDRTDASGLVAELTPLRRGRRAEPETVTVAPRAGALRLRYRIRVEGRPVWIDAWHSADTLPTAVHLRIAPPADAPDALPDLLSAPMVLPVGRGGP